MADRDKTKDLEKELKTAFKEERFEDVRKIASELKKEDPENHFADRILEKMEDAEAAKLRKANIEKIKDLEKQLKKAFKEAQLVEVNKLSEEIKKLDPKNKVVSKVEKRIAKAKASIEEDAKKEKIKALKEEIKDLMKESQTDKVVESANKLLEVDKENSFAIKMLKKAAKEKNVEYTTLMTATPPKEEAKEGVKKETKPIIEEKPAVTPVISEKKEEPEPKALKSTEDEKGEAKAETKTEEKKGFFAGLFKKKTEPSTEKAEPSSTKALEAQKMSKEEIETKAEPVKEEPAKKEASPVTPAQLFAPKPEVIKPGAPAPAPAAPKPAATPPPVPKPVVKAGTFSPFKPGAPAPAPKAPTTPTPVAPKPADTVEPSGDAIGAGHVQPTAEEKGNLFTRLFGKKQAEKTPESIIETIVAQSGKPKPKLERKPIKPVKKEEGLAESYLRYSSLFLKFAVVFIALSAIFFYAFNIDEQNRILGAVGQENYAIRLKNAADELDKKKAKESDINKDIEYYKKGYQNEFEGTIDKIIDNRMNWSSLIRKLNEVTESVYEKNALAKYVEYNNYSYDVKTGQLRVNGTLSDPLGKNLTKLAELEEAFKYYPKDKNDPTDERKPYFFNIQEFSSYAKRLDQATGRFTSNFSLSLYTKEQKK